MTKQPSSFPFVDTHAHLDDPRFKPDLAAVIQRARDRGVLKMITMGAGIASSERAIAIAEAHEGIKAAVGIDPHTAKNYNEHSGAQLERLCRHPRVVALGETGLDFHYYHSTEEEQLRSLRAHLTLARETGLPIIIHNRKAEDAFLQLMAEEDPSNTLTVILHSFAGQLDFAEECLRRGYVLSFSGMLTFDSMPWLKKILVRTPRSKLLFETDSPYLTPAPYRNQKRNEPAMVAETYRFAAATLGMDLEELKRIVAENYVRIFGE